VDPQRPEEHEGGQVAPGEVKNCHDAKFVGELDFVIDDLQPLF
jgi:hypothetical protein